MAGEDQGWVVEHFGFADQPSDSTVARPPARRRPRVRTGVAAIVLALGAFIGTGAVAVAQAADGPGGGPTPHGQVVQADRHRDGPR